ncbi:hypothetical protein CCMSSC00406_0003045 [Pleurotus cornucopiae]|uniref:Uncharacterized protein n=1 Tax=Pleurotus cornucopiae TaxID=5321 RepID=A0ACB7J4Z2_PLECO|nr:hypothetical protein CCMSSC00406_0003045 [Pleurotus cornucopiae]
MPPFLRRGRPIGKPTRKSACKYYFCDCWDCYNSSAIDDHPKGRYLAPFEYKEHQQRRRQEGLVGTYWDASLSQVNLDIDPHRITTAPSIPHLGALAVDDEDEFWQLPVATPAPKLKSRGLRRDRRRVDGLVHMDRYTANLKAIRTRLEGFKLDTLGNALKFIVPPTASSIPPDPTANVDLNLDPDADGNQALLRHEEWLVSARNYVSGHSLRNRTASLRVRATVVLDAIDNASQEALSFRRVHWETCRDAALSRRGPNVIETEYLMKPSYLNFSPILLVSYLLAAALNTLSHLSMKATGDVLKGIRSIQSFGSETTETVPQDIRTVFKALPLLSPRSHAYACCPTCKAMYAFDPDEIAATVPLKCTNRETPTDPECGSNLRAKTRAEREHAERTFLYQDFNHWIAWMFSREDIAKALDDDPYTRSDGEGLKDIWDGEVLRDFNGPDGRRFVIKLPNERRLVFSLNYDSLNPYGNRIAGKAAKISGLYMACLNLPRRLRFLVENIFLVGVVPGPDAPSKDQINHVLRPLVRDLLRLWTEGIFLSQTATHPNGLRVRCALLPVVCDLPAARQVSGLGDSGCGQPCSECKILLRELDDLDHHNWATRNCKEHRRIAAEWLSMDTEQKREVHFNKHFIRWSELLHLPYWDPTKHVVIDSMHGFYLGMLNRHCRIIWGMDHDVVDGDGITFDTTREPPAEVHMSTAHHILRNGTVDALELCPPVILRQLCKDEGLRYSGRLTKKQLIESLVEYRISRQWFDVDDEYVDDNGEASLRPETLEAEAHMIYEFGGKTAIRNKLKLSHARAIYEMKDLADNISNHSGEGSDDSNDLDLDQLRELIQASRKANGIIDSNELLVRVQKAPGRYAGRRTRVLGKNTLSEVVADMRCTTLPTWVGPGPKHPGAAKGGSLKADEWKTFCIIHRSITLPRLWGASDIGSRTHEVLQNYMDLVHAIRLATLRELTLEQINTYEFHMHRYLTNLLRLYPGTSIAPYQHLSLHFGTHLRRWGPTHSWRCFSFERFNGLMQHIQTNSKFGDLEATIFREFCKAQRLRALFNGRSLPPLAQDFVETLSVQQSATIRATFMQDNLAFEERYTAAPSPKSKTMKVLPDNVYWLLIRYLAHHDRLATYVPNKARIHPGVQRLGKSFQSRTPGDSYII